MLTITYSWLDYAIFCLMFSISIVIGIYYGCFGNKQSTTADYLYGGRKMNILPVATSMVAGSVSGIVLLGIPSEVYVNGTQHWLILVGVILMGLINNYVYLPVFYKLQLTSTYEYLQLRFDKYVSKFASFLFIIATLLYLPIVIYVPALAFNQVTGFNQHYVPIIMGVICIFYTTIGGLKSVIWTDTLQFTITLLTFVFLLVLGITSVGGFSYIWEKAQYGERIEFFKVNPDPTLRTSFWSVIFGQTFLMTSLVSVNPAGVQRLLATPTLRHAKITSFLFVVGTVLTLFICCFAGLIIYAKYYDCNPMSTKQITNYDQILPYFVMDVASHIPGINGLFIAGIFSAALTTLSTFLNTLSGLLYTDCVVPFLSQPPSETKASSIMKLTAIVIGIISLCLSLIVEKVGTIIEIYVSLNAITAGPLIGLFTLGMLFPFANAKGALCGGVSSIILMSWIIIKAKLLVYSGHFKYCPKRFYTYGCNFTSVLNATIKATSTPTIICEEKNDMFWLYKITFHYYIVLGTLIVLVIGLFVSWITGTNQKDVNPDLISPFLHRFCVSKSTRDTTMYELVEKEASKDSRQLHVTREKDNDNQLI